MRRRVSVIGSGAAAQALALKLLERDDAEVVLVGEDAADANAAALALGHEARAFTSEGYVELAGSELVVVLAIGPETPGEIARRCPGALVLVVSDEPAVDCAALWPALRPARARLFGRAPCAPTGPLRKAADAVRLVDHVVADRRRVVEVTALCQGEGGRDGWCSTRVVLGATGIVSFA